MQELEFLILKSQSKTHPVLEGHGVDLDDVVAREVQPLQPLERVRSSFSSCDESSISVRQDIPTMNT